MSNEKQVLCQDCLKLKPYTDARHRSEEQCECGGDFCGCLSCQETITALQAGKTKASELGTINDIHGWTPEGVSK
ncbi:TPA: hypothetical protein ACPVYA_004298 [Vibrio parahaemolyticus]|uniref:hypothetical protein n=1 Tax=Vibrio parahaemolyticus TaxID=670 RepID=UPI0002A54CAE|nr:hypothetical protein [Vibrio parahaemolyticus]AGB11013.1 hypothetical protein VPBB_2557 [Vibrio parahaemolyticus BB22OP]MBE4138099.1 hypothetical protein [Vibrio parahaemolyticus]MQF42699.1 hypothetical protein [Vibrio parahaemolyticus]TOZ80019.1 hypothetical protein DXJ97_22645 [Vibrio parahaemolyticus]TOZ99738.1 hypothetical protein DXJ96_22665 [Vibrio parahaemolyticus]